MDIKELKERQSWTLNQKIDHSLGAIEQFKNRMDGKVYVAFSGGKDSTVLMHLCEKIIPDIPCVFVNTGCEYPDIVKFVRNCKEDGHNVEIIQPKMTARAVWEKYGFPLGSKEIAEMVHSLRVNPNSIKSKNALGIGNKGSMFILNKMYRYLIHEPYETSNKCCTILKKDPSKKYGKDHERFPIIGILASESLLREKTYIRRGGCNVFGLHPNSQPLSIWNDDDIWEFIHRYKIKISDIYNKGVDRTGCVACGFGCQYRGDARLKTLYHLYSKYYEHVLNYTNNGVTYREALRKLLSINGIALPDEDTQLTLFN